jgi:ABC-type sugar transport system substrate-binding protein
MARRSFVIGALATLTAPRIAAAQQPKKIPLVGVMLVQRVDHPFPQAFRKGQRRG